MAYFKIVFLNLFEQTGWKRKCTESRRPYSFWVSIHAPEKYNLEESLQIEYSLVPLPLLKTR